MMSVNLSITELPLAPFAWSRCTSQDMSLDLRRRTIHESEGPAFDHVESFVQNTEVLACGMLFEDGGEDIYTAETLHGFRLSAQKSVPEAEITSSSPVDGDFTSNPQAKRMLPSDEIDDLSPSETSSDEATTSPQLSTPSLTSSSGSYSDGDSIEFESTDGGERPAEAEREIVQGVNYVGLLSWYPEWRDEVIRRIDHFFELPTAMLRWDVVRNGIKVYPLSIYYMREFLWRHSGYTDNALFIQAIGNFHEAMSDWLAWDAVTSIVNSAEVSARISAIVDQFKITWDVVIGGFIRFPLSKWTTVFQIALELDREDMSLVIAKLMSSPSTRDEIFKLNGDDLRNLLDRLQSLIDYKPTNHRYLEQLLVKLVRKSGVLPPHLIVQGACRIGFNPVAGGGFADVWQGVMNGKSIALKVLRLFGRPEDRAAMLNAFCKEAMVWRLFKHENVCPFYGVCVDVFAPQYAFVSPWMPNGDMMSYLKNFPDTDRVKMLGEVALGLCYLHMFCPRVIHGDLRGVNVLIDALGRPRVADFGLARVIDSQASTMAGTSFNGKGSMRWQAPELLGTIRFDGGEGDVTTKSDVYAFACVCLEVFTSEIPWANLRDGGVIMEVLVHDRRPQRPTEPATQRGLDDAIWDLMQTCWKKAPSDRPEMTTVVNLLLPGYTWKEHKSQKSFNIEDSLQMSLRRCSALERSEFLLGNRSMD